MARQARVDHTLHLTPRLEPARDRQRILAVAAACEWLESSVRAGRGSCRTGRKCHRPRCCRNSRRSRSAASALTTATNRRSCPSVRSSIWWSSAPRLRNHDRAAAAPTDLRTCCRHPPTGRGGGRGSRRPPDPRASASDWSGFQPTAGASQGESRVRLAQGSLKSTRVIARPAEALAHAFKQTECPAVQVIGRDDMRAGVQAFKHCRDRGEP